MEVEEDGEGDGGQESDWRLSVEWVMDERKVLWYVAVLMFDGGVSVTVLGLVEGGYVIPFLS